MSSLLPINDTSALFEICWMQSINAGLQWSQLVGCFFIFYCFFFAEKKTLWYVLIAHSITGFIGVLVETLFSALRCAGNTNPQVAYLLAFNEINWIIFEASTVIYSFLKTNTIISNQLVRTTTNVFMFCALCVFAGFRMHIGVLRFNENSLMTPSIAEAHSRAFVVWGLTDVIVFVLMLYATITQLREATETEKGIVKTLVKSSLPRIMILCLNTFSVVVIGQLQAPLSPRVQNFNTLIWMVKGTYPSILLLDILVTREMLMPHKQKHAEAPSLRPQTSDRFELVLKRGYGSEPSV